MSNELVPFERQMVLAEAFASSGLFGIKSKEQALALMALCEAQGLHPSNAIAEYHIVTIGGTSRPSLKAEAMLARFQKAGGSVKFLRLDDQCCEAEFSHPQGGTISLSWDIDRAKRAGVYKDMWIKYPRQMLRSRVVSEGVRTIYPGVLGGMYEPEEIAAIEPPKRDFSPYPEGIKAMDSEYRDQFTAGILQHLEASQAKTVGDLPNDDEIKSAWKLWIELDQDEQIQVFQKFNTKQKDRWRKVESAMTRPRVNGSEPHGEVANGLA